MNPDAVAEPTDPSDSSETGASATETSLPLDRIHQGDCVELLARVADESIDLAFADPPFNIGFKYDEYHDEHDDDAYLGWCRQWIGELHRVVKPTGSFWLAIGDEYAAELKVAAKEIGFTARNWIVWYYTFGQNCTRKFNRSHAHLFHFVKDEERHTFNAEDPAVRVPSARALVYGDRRANPTGRLPDDTWILRPQDLRESPDAFQPMDDTWYFSRVAGTFKERQGFHGCQMPEQLLGRIVRISSNPNDVVLDPFAGSGTTLAVAKKLGRRWLGLELSSDYAKYGNERVDGATDEETLNGPADPVGSAPTTDKGRKLKGHPLVENAASSPAGGASPATGSTATGSSADAQHEAKPAATANPSLRELTEQALINAFLEARTDESIDWLLCDPTLQDRFHALCEKTGLIGGPADWNRELLRLRKAGKTPKLATVRRNELSTDRLDRLAYAAEIAWRETLRKYPEASLDEVFSSPGKSLAFDRIAAKHAGAERDAASAYRWAALRLRKARHSLAKEAKKYHYVVGSRDFGRFQALARMRLDRVDSAPGLYLLRAKDRSALYVGETLNLAQRLADHLASRSGLRLAPQVSVITAADLPSDEYRQPLWVDLVRRYQPRLNVPPVELEA
ncbi:MAG: DNA methyltransferase [Planctomycetota bacterium]